MKRCTKVMRICLWEGRGTYTELLRCCVLPTHHILWGGFPAGVLPLSCCLEIFQHVAAVDEAIRNVFTARDGELISHVSFNRPCGSQTNGNTEVKAFPNVWENMMLVWFHALSHEGVRLCGFVVFQAGHFCICSVSLCADSQVHRNQSYAVSVTHEHWAKHLIASSLSDRWEDLHHPQNNLSNVKLQYSH